MLNGEVVNNAEKKRGGWKRFRHPLSGGLLEPALDDFVYGAYYPRRVQEVHVSHSLGVVRATHVETVCVLAAHVQSPTRYQSNDSKTRTSTCTRQTDSDTHAHTRIHTWNRNNTNIRFFELVVVHVRHPKARVVHNSAPSLHRRIHTACGQEKSGSAIEVRSLYSLIALSTTKTANLTTVSTFVSFGEKRPGDRNMLHAIRRTRG
jgi:hypothetical protein